jgi:L-amino acid N-acyltransferase YncA
VTIARILVRLVRPDDVPVLCGLLNEIIRIGGTTAYETPLTEADFDEHFVTGPDLLSCFVAYDRDGLLLGFQVIGRSPDLPEGWADIATFARAVPKVRGVGAALFAATGARARALGLTAINATIRADNASGLAYYAKMGFEDYAVAKAVPLMDGAPVDRISKRFLVR